MADQADIASRNEFTEEALRKYQSQTKMTVNRGSCLHCGESIGSDKIFCDLECRVDFEHEQEVTSRTRKP